MNWLAALQALPPHCVGVQHVPETPRYVRARVKLDFLLQRGILLGIRRGEVALSMEVAGWAPPGHGRGPGYYFCFRVFMRDDQPERAVLFCFWDGTEGSRGFRSRSAALLFARGNGFQERGDECLS